jgi:ubiquinone/menaquinone biosynthesis C-methylase UbiE
MKRNSITAHAVGERRSEIAEWEQSNSDVKWLTLCVIRREVLMRTITKWIKPGAVFLEAGCGVGRRLFVCALNPNIKHAVGLDFSKELIKTTRKFKAKYGFHNISLIVADTMHLPFQTGKFDIISSLGVIEHFPNPQLAIREMSETLKTGGYLFLETPNKNSYATTSMWTKTAIEKFGRQDLYSPEQLAQLTEKHKLRTIMVTGDDFGGSIAQLMNDRLGKHLPKPFIQPVFQSVKVLCNLLNPVMKHRGFLSVVIAKRTAD